MLDEIPMETATQNPKVGQIINWYLDCAADGNQSTEGTPKSPENLRILKSVAEHHTPGAFRSRRFAELTASDMQIVIDDAAADGAEGAAFRLKTFFVDIEKFAMRKGVISKMRTHKLVSPTNCRKDRPLSEREFAEAWRAYRLYAEGGPVVSRGACWLILLSGTTLQPMHTLLSMRRAEIDFDRRLWVSPRADGSKHYVHLTDLALELVRSAIELGDFSNRTVPTELVFPENGLKGDPAKTCSYSTAFDVTEKVLPRANVKPLDLRQTGLAELYKMGGEPFWSVLEIISGECLETLTAEQIAISEAWTSRITAMLTKIEAARWR